MHNLWRAKLLYDLNYGQPSFRSRDSKKVQEIISEAGKGSYAALGVELKIKYVNVQRLISPFSCYIQSTSFKRFLEQNIRQHKNMQIVLHLY